MIQRRIETSDYEALKEIKQKLQRENRAHATIMTIYLWALFLILLLFQKTSSSPDIYSEVNVVVGLVYGSVMACLLWCGFVLLFDIALPKDKRRASPAFNLIVIAMLAVIIIINSLLPDVQELFAGLTRSGRNIGFLIFSILTAVAMVTLIFFLLKRQERYRTALESESEVQ